MYIGLGCEWYRTEVHGLLVQMRSVGLVFEWDWTCMPGSGPMLLPPTTALAGPHKQRLGPIPPLPGICILETCPGALLYLHLPSPPKKAGLWGSILPPLGPWALSSGPRDLHHFHQAPTHQDEDLSLHATSSRPLHTRTGSLAVLCT